MSSTAQTVKELLPVPATTAPLMRPDDVEKSDTMDEKPTTSHALAVTDRDERGAVGVCDAPSDQNDDEVADLGWNEPPSQIPAPLIGGLPNEELWLLVRRFNKQTYHVKEMPQPPPGLLDMNIAEEDEFSPDKLRAGLERLYMTIIIGLVSLVKQLARLRSWKESRRTSIFCAAYFAAWFFDLLMPLFSATVIALVAFPPSRSFLFPPAPIALVDSSTGGLQKPKAGTLGSHDSATGAPEHHKGEAVEQEAANFVNSIAAVALSSAAGKHPADEVVEQGDAHEPEVVDESVPDPTAIAVGAADAKHKTSGAPLKKDKTKIPMETTIWMKMRPLMHGIGDLADSWERFANALSPTRPFPRDIPRLRIALAVVPLFCISLVVPAYVFVKGATFGMGFAFFGDPIIKPGWRWFNRRFPNWQAVLELRNTLLKGVPTNAQLSITLLRIGEANKAPLPPPPRNKEAPPDTPIAITEDDLGTTGDDRPLDASPQEVAAVLSPEPSKAHETDGVDIEKSKASTHGQKGARILHMLRGTTKAAVESAITADSVKAKVGSEPAKTRLGVVPRPEPDRVSGPVEFKSRFHGHRGHVFISAVPDDHPELAMVSFTRDSVLRKTGMSGREKEEQNAEWCVAIGEIAELKKLGGYGWKTKLVVGWALEKEVTDGLEITTRHRESFKVTACPLRDELFNRLVSMGGQKWESW